MTWATLWYTLEIRRCQCYTVREFIKFIKLKVRLGPRDVIDFKDVMDF